MRTAWLYGAHGGNFVATMIRLEREQPTVMWWTTSTGSPPRRRPSPSLIVALINAGAPAGIYHATCSGQTTWCGLAQEVFRLARR